jgi:ABC-2 type transport system permease protein
MARSASLDATAPRPPLPPAPPPRATGPRSPLFEPTVAAVTRRALLGRKRSVLLAIPGLVLLGLTLVLKSVSGAGTAWPDDLLGHVGFSAVLPLTALVVGTSVLGSEIDDGSILHLLATPVRRSSIVVTKACVAALTTIVFAAVPEVLAALIAAGSFTRLAAGLGAGAVLASCVYSAVFVLLSVLVRQPVAYALGYVVLWEGLVTNLIGGAKFLSVEQYALGVANAIAKQGSLGARLTAPTALVLAALATVGALYAASSRLKSFTLAGDS